MTRHVAVFAAVLASLVLVGLIAWQRTRREPAPVAHIPAGATLLQMPHYRVYSTATPAQTQQVGDAAESLHAAYRKLFAAEIGGSTPPLTLVLYASRVEFQRNNRSRPWAEAYYLQPASYAYYRDGANTYHWMLHEVVHQLNTEVAGWRLPTWANEGVASYLGASWLEDGVLTPGRSDPNAYPIWWLSRMQLTGNRQADIAAGRLIPLRDLLEGRGPDINRHVNLYYLHYWSLSHFLFHYQDGKYAAGYKQLLARGASTPDFERLIGPVEDVEAAWYTYLVEAMKRMQRYDADNSSER